MLAQKSVPVVDKSGSVGLCVERVLKREERESVGAGGSDNDSLLGGRGWGVEMR